MLLELRVENLVLIERAALRLAPGLNVLTGETGAGKTMLATALDLLLGGKAGAGMVRPGAAEAWVEGAFERPPGLPAAIEERLPPGEDELVVARRVWPDGRTRAYLGGRSATIGDLRELGERLLAFYGQHEHRRLALASAQLAALDGFCGPEQLARRESAAAAHGEVRELERRLEELSGLAGARERELDLLEFELTEIETVDPRPGEDGALPAERDRLRHLDGLRAGALAGAEAIAPEAGEEPGVAGALAAAERALDGVAGVDPALDALAERLRGVAIEAGDLAGELRRYEESVEAPAGRLEEVEERLAALSRLERKHGGSVASVLEHAESCRERLEELRGVEVALGDAEASLTEARARRAALAAGLRAARAEAAPALAEAVRGRLAELAMPDARFEVLLEPRKEPGPAGEDAVEFRIAPNRGVPDGPLRDIASGGELSRVMLALLGVAHGEEPDADRRLLVFDEVDAGVGGRTANAVGAQLRALAAGRQVLCITHLPQVASLADAHFRIAKSPAGEASLTTVEPIDGEELVGELVRMLGADDADRAARDHARELLRAA